MTILGAIVFPNNRTNHGVHIVGHEDLDPARIRICTRLAGRSSGENGVKRLGEPKFQYSLGRKFIRGVFAVDNQRRSVGNDTLLFLIRKINKLILIMASSGQTIPSKFPFFGQRGLNFKIFSVGYCYRSTAALKILKTTRKLTTGVGIIHWNTAVCWWKNRA